MIREPMGIVAVLLAVEGAVLLAADMPGLRRVFRYVPAMFWIYFLPMLANTAGLISPAHDAAGAVVTPVYGTITTYGLPACLVLLLLDVDLRAIWRLGGVAIGVMGAGFAGTMLGAPVVLLLFGRWLPADIWTGIGALSASWMGGSVNMIAVARSIATPPKILGMMIVVDTIVPYAWMGLLIVLSAHQRRFDRWNRSRGQIVEDLKRRAAGSRVEARPAALKHVAAMLAVAAVAAWAAIALSRMLPVVEQMISASAWAIVLATTMGIALSFTPARRLEAYGSSSAGYALLYFVLASIGAKTSLGQLGDAPLLIVAGFVWVLIHAAVVLAAGRLLRAPMALLAAASQANLGGAASAPVVAQVYQPGLAPVGLLLAVMGNILGTYLGILTATLCRYVSQW